MTFKDTLRDVYDACGPIFYRRPSNEDILQAATQIYIAQMKNECSEAFKELKENIPMIFELEGKE